MTGRSTFDVEEIAKSLAEKVEAQYGQRQRRSGKQRNPGRDAKGFHAVVDHAAPAGRRGLSAKTQKRQPGLGHDGLRQPHRPPDQGGNVTVG